VALSDSLCGALAYELEARISPEVHKEVIALCRGGLASQSGERKERKQAERAAAPSHKLDLLAAGLAIEQRPLRSINPRAQTEDALCFFTGGVATLRPAARENGAGKRYITSWE
jgi:hypothetical protein